MESATTLAAVARTAKIQSLRFGLYEKSAAPKRASRFGSRFAGAFTRLAPTLSAWRVSDPYMSSSSTNSACS
jgi:hypothetical protein